VSDQRAAAGWFPDPTGRFEFRYHNGTQWTADVSVGGRRFVDQVGTPTWQPGWTPPADAPATPGKGLAVASFVVALVSLVVAWLPFVFALAAIGAVVAFVFGIIGLRRAAVRDGYGRGYAVAGVALSLAAAVLCVVGFLFTRAVLREVGDFLDPGRYTVSIDVCDTQSSPVDTGSPAQLVFPRLVTVEGSITNNETEARAYTITIDYLVDGARAEGDTVRVDAVRPGSTATFEATAFVETATPVQCQVVDVFGPTPFDQTNS
jgi:hypothetical protein